MLIALLLCNTVLKAHAETTIFQNGSEAYQGTHDVSLRGDFPELMDANLWGEYALSISGVPNGGAKSMGLIRFDDIIGTGKNQLPAGATVTKAHLELWKLQDQPRDDGQYEKSAPHDIISIFQMKTHFLAGDAADKSNIKAATFSYRANDPELPEFWGDKNQLETGPVAEVDYEKTPLAFTKLQPKTENLWMSWDVTSAVRDWLSRKAPNEGFYLMTQGYWIGATFASSEAETVEHRPRLLVEWTPAAPEK